MALKLNKSKQIFWFLLTFLIFLSYTNQQNQNQQGLEQTCLFSDSPCNNKGTCTDQGFCLCDTYYYGQNCEKELSGDSRPEVKQGQIKSGEITGIVLGWIFTVLIIYLGGLFFFYRQYKKEKNRGNNNIIEVAQEEDPLEQHAVPMAQQLNEPNYENIYNHPLYESSKQLNDQINGIQHFEIKKNNNYSKHSTLFLQINDDTDDYGKKFIQLLKKQEDIDANIVQVEVEEESKNEQVLQQIQSAKPENIQKKTESDQNQFISPQPADERYSNSKAGEQKPRISIQMPHKLPPIRQEKNKQKGINRTNVISSDASLLSDYDYSSAQKSKRRFSNIDSIRKKSYQSDEDEDDDDFGILNLKQQHQKKETQNPLQQQKQNIPQTKMQNLFQIHEDFGDQYQENQNFAIYIISDIKNQALQNVQPNNTIQQIKQRIIQLQNNKQEALLLFDEEDEEELQ
ncbi:hypothetical protein PPERSA_10800 [Pseudocohnilembus persalinus]|uniref:EGF-like domain-containing protein n=1 Tax=Pseudocohnilembus persalinus TaxID=266149 RepID=A0A0V0QDM4_PSEPJ|nr:hypothetical protein PPERSA_10800 [Pseudocohnilembus persalinus]|eukprot:KRX00301.1 hypothetical protein PPERSA_10800 [Pseudocohnilembus persalinus]